MAPPSSSDSDIMSTLMNDDFEEFEEENAVEAVLTLDEVTVQVDQFDQSASSSDTFQFIESSGPTLSETKNYQMPDEVQLSKSDAPSKEVDFVVPSSDPLEQVAEPVHTGQGALFSVSSESDFDLKEVHKRQQFQNFVGTYSTSSSAIFKIRELSILMIEDEMLQLWAVDSEGNPHVQLLIPMELIIRPISTVVRTKSTSGSPSVLNLSSCASNFLAVHGMMDTTTRFFFFISSCSGSVFLATAPNICCGDLQLETCGIISGK